MRAQILATVALLLAGSAAAQAPSAMRFERGGPPPPPSIERAAIHNLVATALAQRTGRSAEEIGELLNDERPSAVASRLGLDGEALRSAFEQAHTALVDATLNAGLITMEQAKGLRTLPPLPDRPTSR